MKNIIITFALLFSFCIGFCQDQKTEMEQIKFSQNEAGKHLVAAGGLLIGSTAIAAVSSAVAVVGTTSGDQTLVLMSGVLGASSLVMFLAATVNLINAGQELKMAKSDLDQKEQELKQLREQNLQYQKDTNK